MQALYRLYEQSCKILKKYTNKFLQLNENAPLYKVGYIYLKKWYL